MEGDFRFRIEQDWNSLKSDGSLRDNRTRLRYRLRFGTVYSHEWYSVGYRIRTGSPVKQQDAQLTLGDGFKEFGTLPIGLEKVFFQGQWKHLKFWIGKNSFPFEKSNELFWSDNVYPEGVYLGKGFRFDSKIISEIDLKTGHFILTTRGKSLLDDSYFQGYQASLVAIQNRVKIFPAVYLFRNTPNIPDGNESFELNYSIFHLGSRFTLLPKPRLNIEFDYYHNFEDYSRNDSIPANFKDQKSGFVLGLSCGRLKQKKDWLVKASLANIQQFSILDFWRKMTGRDGIILQRVPLMGDCLISKELKSSRVT